MADLNVWFAPQAMIAPGRDTVPALLIDDEVGARETVTDCATSKQTQAAPDVDDSGYTPFIAQAIGGGLWVAVGANPTAVANAAGTLYLAEGMAMSGVVKRGKKLAAINA